MQWPATVARRRTVPLLVRRKMNGCSLFGCSARSNRLRENRCPDFSLLLLLGAYEQISGADKQVPKGGCGPCPKNTSGPGNSVRASKKVFGPTRNAERKGRIPRH